MKTVKLHDGRTIQLPATLSDYDVQRVVEILMQKMGIAEVEEDERSITIVQTPDVNIPETKDYSDVIMRAAKSITATDNTQAAQEICKAIGMACAKIDMQTKAITDALNMQNEVLAELVVAYREPKKIMRDEMGRPEGIE